MRGTSPTCARYSHPPPDVFSCHYFSGHIFHNFLQISFMIYSFSLGITRAHSLLFVKQSNWDTRGTSFTFIFLLSMPPGTPSCQSRAISNYFQGLSSMVGYVMHCLWLSKNRVTNVPLSRDQLSSKDCQQAVRFNDISDDKPNFQSYKQVIYLSHPRFS